MEWDRVHKQVDSTFSPQQIPPVLRQWEASEAKLWHYTISLGRRFAIRLSRDDKEEHLYICCLGCDFFCGKFRYNELTLTIEYSNNEMEDEHLCVLHDDENSFELKCRSVLLLITDKLFSFSFE